LTWGINRPKAKQVPETVIGEGERNGQQVPR